MEDRYIVLKRSDVEKLDPIRQFQLSWVMEDVSRARQARGASPLCAVVVEADWPEYEPTVQMLEQRINNTKE